MAISDIGPLRQRAYGAWRHYQTALIALSIGLLGGGLRLYRADAHGLRLDELFSVWMNKRDLSELVYEIVVQRVDANPPLYYVLLHALLHFGQNLLLIRAISIVAGTLIVWLTFHLAANLFDVRIASLSALLIAIAPLHIEYSQVARSYILVDLWALLSLFLFAKLLFGQSRKRYWIGFVAATAAALYTHYLIFMLLVLFENAVIAFLWLRRRAPRQLIVNWAISQVVLGLTLLPLTVALADAAPAEAQNWLARPDLLALVRSVILFSTGDPSSGPAGPTVARALSLITILGVGMLGLWTYFSRRSDLAGSAEAQRVLLLVSAVAMQWMAAFAISQVRNVYKEKYLLFLLPPLVILIAWVIMRARKTAIAALLLAALISLNGSALFVYYTAPVGEQWREAIAYMRSTYQPGDLVVITPGFYVRPFVYYMHGDFPDELRPIPRMLPLAHAPALLARSEEIQALYLQETADGIEANNSALASARRVWFVSGFAPADPAVMRLMSRYFEPLDVGEFFGARVQLMQRVRDQLK